MYFKYDDMQVYYEKYGNNKKSIIILPGWGNTRTTFSYMINFLKEYFTVYILDYPGFGNSSNLSYDFTIYDYSNLVYDWIKSLDITNPILIGHSFGGRIITTLLGYFNYKFDNIIYLNSAGIKPKIKLKTYLYKFLKKLKFFLPKKIKEKYQHFLFKKFASSDYNSLPENMLNTFKNIVNEDLKPYLKDIKSRTLIIWGNNDKTTPVKDAFIMNKLIKDSELIIMPNSNHFTYLDNPNLINNIIYEQLKSEI